MPVLPVCLSHILTTHTTPCSSLNHLLPTATTTQQQQHNVPCGHLVQGPVSCCAQCKGERQDASTCCCLLRGTAGAAAVTIQLLQLQLRARARVCVHTHHTPRGTTRQRQRGTDAHTHTQSTQLQASVAVNQQHTYHPTKLCSMPATTQPPCTTHIQRTVFSEWNKAVLSS